MAKKKRHRKSASGDKVARTIHTVSDSDRLQYKFDYNAKETAELKGKSYERLSVEDLRRFALWKLDRVLSVPESLLQKLRGIATNKSLKANDEDARDALKELVQCEGVWYPMASAFLKFIRPDVFPIIDVRAYRALCGRKIRRDEYDIDVYLDYVDRVRELAHKRGMKLHLVDEQLYCFDKRKNGAIGE